MEGVDHREGEEGVIQLLGHADDAALVATLALRKGLVATTAAVLIDILWFWSSGRVLISKR